MPADKRRPRADDRRWQERRGIEIRLPIHSPLPIVYQFLRNFANLSRSIPEITGLKREKEDIWQLNVLVDGTPAKATLQVMFDDAKSSIGFKGVGGDFDACEGTIQVAPMPGAALVTFRLYLRFGFDGLERFMGHVIKEKIRKGVIGALSLLKKRMEAANPAPAKFAFLIHSTDLDLYGAVLNDDPCEEGKKDLLETVCKWIPPFKGSHIYGIETPEGKIIEGDFIYSTLTPRLIMQQDQKFVLDHMIQAGRLAEELGARILGLGAYAAFVGRRGVQIAEKLSIPVTTGASYTVWAALDAMCKAGALTEMNLKDATLAVIGATGTLAGACAEFLAPGAGAMILIGRQIPRLQALKGKLEAIAPELQIDIATEIEKTVGRADMVLICTSSPDVLLDVAWLKSGAVVCDLSQPKNISRANAMTRKDVLVIDGGVIRPPGDVRFNFFFGLPPGLAFACMAETMILTLEGRFESYSIGGNISSERVREIGLLAQKHGFELSDLKSFGKTITTEDLNAVRKARA